MNRPAIEVTEMEASVSTLKPRTTSDLTKAGLATIQQAWETDGQTEIYLDEAA